MHLKLNNTSQISQVFNLIKNLPNYFHQIKFAYHGKDFLQRRDNMILYLNKENQVDLIFNDGAIARNIDKSFF